MVKHTVGLVLKGLSLPNFIIQSEKIREQKCACFDAVCVAVFIIVTNLLQNSMVQFFLCMIYILSIHNTWCIHGMLMIFLNICDNKVSSEIGKCIRKVSVNGGPGFSPCNFVEISGKFSGI